MPYSWQQKFTLHFTLIQGITSNLLVVILSHTVGQRGAWCLIPKGKDRADPLVCFLIVIFFPLLVYTIPVFCLCLFLKAQVATVFRTTSLASDARVYCRKQIIVDSFSFITHDSHLGLWPYLGTWNQLRWLQDKICYALFIYLFFHHCFDHGPLTESRNFSNLCCPKVFKYQLCLLNCVFIHVYTEEQKVCIM